MTKLDLTHGNILLIEAYSTTFRCILKLYTNLLNYNPYFKEISTLYTYKHPRPSAAVDITVFRIKKGKYQVLLIQRSQEPFLGSYALPGGFMEMEETLEDAARRELSEETGLENQQLIQVQTFSDPGRDPRDRVISTCFGVVLKESDQIQIQAGSDAEDIRWFDLEDLPGLAFDHLQIILTAAKKLILT
ncbi:MAG: NUDIX hydrolase [Anaerolineales bacterium]|nr:MAG: NUDIX hydrolase [Anaerolineales bacterium]